MGFNVIVFDPNRREFKSYDVIPYFLGRYAEEKKKPKTFDEFKKMVSEESMYRFWAKCEWEIILSDWPGQRTEEKWDVHRQVMMNIDLVTKIVMESV